MTLDCFYLNSGMVALIDMSIDLNLQKMYLFKVDCQASYPNLY